MQLGNLPLQDISLCSGARNILSSTVSIHSANDMSHLLITVYLLCHMFADGEDLDE